MKVKLNVTYVAKASDGKTDVEHEPGKVVDVDSDEAERLISRGHAAAVAKKAAEAEKAPADPKDPAPKDPKA